MMKSNKIASAVFALLLGIALVFSGCGIHSGSANAPVFLVKDATLCSDNAVLTYYTIKSTRDWNNSQIEAIHFVDTTGKYKVGDYIDFKTIGKVTPPAPPVEQVRDENFIAQRRGMYPEYENKLIVAYTQGLDAYTSELLKFFKEMKYDADNGIITQEEFTTYSIKWYKYGK